MTRTDSPIVSKPDLARTKVVAATLVAPGVVNIHIEGDFPDGCPWFSWVDQSDKRDVDFTVYWMRLASPETICTFMLQHFEYDRLFQVQGSPKSISVTDATGTRQVQVTSGRGGTDAAALMAGGGDVPIPYMPAYRIVVKSVKG